MRMKQAGLIDYVERNLRYRRTACKLTNVMQHGNRVVKIFMQDLSGAFFMLLVGYLASAIAFAIECVIGRF